MPLHPCLPWWPLCKSTESCVLIPSESILLGRKTTVRLMHLACFNIQFHSNNVNIDYNSKTNLHSLSEYRLQLQDKSVQSLSEHRLQQHDKFACSLSEQIATASHIFIFLSEQIDTIEPPCHDAHRKHLLVCAVINLLNNTFLKQLTYSKLDLEA